MLRSGKMHSEFPCCFISNDIFLLCLIKNINKPTGDGRWHVSLVRFNSMISEVHNNAHYTSHLTISLYLSRASWATCWMKGGSSRSNPPGTEMISGGEFRMFTSTFLSLTESFCPSWLFGATWRVEDVLSHPHHWMFVYLKCWKWICRVSYMQNPFRESPPYFQWSLQRIGLGSHPNHNTLSLISPFAHHGDAEDVFRSAAVVHGLSHPAELSSHVTEPVNCFISVVLNDGQDLVVLLSGDVQ